MSLYKNHITPFLLISLFSIQLISEDIEEIIIKGEWRESSRSEKDSSILIFDSKVIKDQPIKHFENLAYLVPNLNFAASDSRARYFQIRGIGERSGYQGTPNTSVGFLIDDIDYSGQGGIATTFDVDQIEIHRGPQGSRIGANALAGLIYIKTKDPTDTFEGTSELTIGSYGTSSIGLAFGGPIKRNISYRLAIRKDNSDGFRKNLYLNRSDTSKKDESTYRLKLDWKPNGDTVVKFLLAQVDLNDPADIWTIDGSLNTLSDKPGMDSQKTSSNGFKVVHNFNGFEFQSLTSSTDTNVVFSYDADWGNPDSHFPYIYDYFSETIRDRTSFNQEFRLISDSFNYKEGKYTEWVAGISYLSLKEKNLKHDNGIYGDPSDPYSPYISKSSSSSKYKSDNYSIFGNVGYLLNESLKISVGLRWEVWEANYSDSLNESFNPSNKMNGGKISLSKEISKATNIFMTVAKGYKKGGFNLGLTSEPGIQNDDLIYNPEFLTNYEIGMKSEILKSGINFDGVIFYSDRKNQQVLISSQVDPTDPNTFLFLTQNAAKGINYGFEGNLNFEITEHIEIYGNLGILKTEIRDWVSRPELEGRAQAHAPEKSYSMGLNIDINTNAYLSINISGKSGFYYSDSHNNKSKSYTLSDITYGYINNDWKYKIWVRNLFNKYYSVRGFYFGNEAPDFENTLYERHGDPRHIGLSVEYDF